MIFCRCHQLGQEPCAGALSARRGINGNGQNLGLIGDHLAQGKPDRFVDHKDMRALE